MRLLPRELHTTDRPSATAQWTTLGRALELHRPPEQRIVDDSYAPIFLSRRSQAMLAALRRGQPALRVAERAELAGLAAFALCRHRFIDEQLLVGLHAQVEQVLILGAGYDSRAYRFAAELSGRPVHEVDLAPLSRRKASIVAAHPQLFSVNSIRRIEIDFRVDSLQQRLTDSGFVVGAPTFVAWEGVSMYLSGAAVCATLETLRAVCGPQSVLAMDYWYPIDGRRPVDHIRRLGAQAIALVGEPVTFGVAPTKIDGFLAEHGFAMFDIAESVHLAERYATDGRHSERSVYVVAARL
ncbi:MAG: SAM-dependent methyltransferase [Actinomycetota bacterium]|nr:SAM-dependent methyltransferase [Actinomycetota bacterium]